MLSSCSQLIANYIGVIKRNSLFKVSRGQQAVPQDLSTNAEQHGIAYVCMWKITLTCQQSTGLGRRGNHNKASRWSSKVQSSVLHGRDQTKSVLLMQDILRTAFVAFMQPATHCTACCSSPSRARGQVNMVKLLNAVGQCMCTALDTAVTIVVFLSETPM